MLLLIKFAITFQLYSYLRNINTASREENENLVAFTFSLEKENYYHHACVLFQQKLAQNGFYNINFSEENFIDSGMIDRLSNLSYIFDHNLNCQIIEVPKQEGKGFSSIFFYPSLEIRSKYLLKIPLNDELIQDLFCHHLDLLIKNNKVRFRKKDSLTKNMDQNFEIPIFSNLKKMFRSYDFMYPSQSERGYHNLTMCDYHFPTDPLIGLRPYVSDSDPYPSFMNRGSSKQVDESRSDLTLEESLKRLSFDQSKGALPKRKNVKSNLSSETFFNQQSGSQTFTSRESSLFPEENKYLDKRYSEEPLFNGDMPSNENTDQSFNPNRYDCLSNNPRSLNFQDDLDPNVPQREKNPSTYEFSDSSKTRPLDDFVCGHPQKKQ
ncbi:hypothetical protein DMUE_0994 [Dictyocoela muelleri]|nr:hypothetical protein DMUE_0994 [Dictyocoela muelleri]